MNTVDVDVGKIPVIASHDPCSPTINVIGVPYVKPAARAPMLIVSVES